MNVDNTGFNMSNVDLSVDVQVGAGGFGISDGEYLPIVKVALSTQDGLIQRASWLRSLNSR